MIPSSKHVRRSLRKARKLEQKIGQGPSALEANLQCYKKHLLDAIRKADRELNRSLPEFVQKFRLRRLEQQNKLRKIGTRQLDRNAASFSYDVTVEAARQANCGVFPISGTLLGLIREGDFLPHDYDIDFGIMSETNIEKYWHLVSILANNPNVIAVSMRYASSSEIFLNPPLRTAASLPLKTKINFQNGVSVDIFNHFTFKGKVFHGGGNNIWSNSSFDLTHDNPISRGAWIPSQPEKYLEENYGDWRTPQKNYVFYLDTPNWEPIVSAASLDFFIREAIKFSIYDPHTCARVRNQALQSFEKKIQFISHHI